MEQILMRTNEGFTRLQGLTTFLSQQQQFLNEIVSDFCADVQAIHPTKFSNEDQANPIFVISGKYAVTMTKAQNFIFNEGGLYCVESCDKLSIEERQLATRSVAEFLVCLIDGISNIVVEQDNLNASSDLETPPCLPHDLVSLSGHDFAELLQSQKGRIVTACNEQELDGLQGEFQELVCMHQRNETIKAALDTCTSKSSFEGGWGILGTQFQKLNLLCGGFASVFP
jgi:hypothetical protein